MKQHGKTGESTLTRAAETALSESRDDEIRATGQDCLAGELCQVGMHNRGLCIQI